MATPISFEPVGEQNLRDFVRITRESLWHPLWPGDEAVAREFWRWPLFVQHGARLIYHGRKLIGRVIAAQFDSYLIIRELGLCPERGLPERVASALLALADRQSADVVRVIVQAPLWPSLFAHGFEEQKRRTTMCRDLRQPPLAVGVTNIRNVAPDDLPDIGELMIAAYVGTTDDEGEDLAQWTDQMSDVIRGLYGKFLESASFVTPPQPPFNSATLVVESAPRSAVLGHVVTRQEHTNRGHARRLISHSLAILARLGYQACFLEATLTNANAIHLYHSLGFETVGPNIIYGIKQIR